MPISIIKNGQTFDLVDGFAVLGDGTPLDFIQVKKNNVIDKVWRRVKPNSNLIAGRSVSTQGGGMISGSFSVPLPDGIKGVSATAYFSGGWTWGGDGTLAIIDNTTGQTLHSASASVPWASVTTRNQEWFSINYTVPIDTAMNHSLTLKYTYTARSYNEENGVVYGGTSAAISSATGTFYY